MILTVLQRIAGGDSTAVRECIEKYGGLVWSLARRFSRSFSDAEDATQEIFLDIWRSSAKFDPSRGSAEAYIATIARRRLVDRWRKVKREPPMDTVEVLDRVVWSYPPDTASETSVDMDNAARAFAQLRPRHREVLELALLNGLSHAEIATKMNMPLGTVKSFLRRGLIQVREYMNIPVSAAARTPLIAV